MLFVSCKFKQFLHRLCQRFSHPPTIFAKIKDKLRVWGFFYSKEQESIFTAVCHSVIPSLCHSVNLSENFNLATNF